MKNLFIILLAFSIISDVYSQQRKVGDVLFSLKEYSGEYYTNDNDTVSCYIKLKVNPFYKDLINPLSCKYLVRIIDSSGTATDFDVYHIKGFSIDSTYYGKMTFESLPYRDYGISFVERVKSGDISLYKYYFPDAYDGSPEFYYYVRKNSEYISIGGVGFKKKISSLLQDKDMAYQAFLKGRFKYKDLPEIIDLYNNSD